MSEIAVRLIGASYAPAVAELEKRCFDVPWTLKMVELEFSHNYSSYYGAFDGDTLIGYLGCIVVTDEGYISNLACVPEYRRRGVASSLLGALISRALEEGLRFLTLEVRESNAPAVSLYEKHGFEVWGKRPKYYSRPVEDALVMTRSFE